MVQFTSSICIIALHEIYFAFCESFVSSFSEAKSICLKSDVPVDFEYKINLLQSVPAIQVEPQQGNLCLNVLHFPAFVRIMRKWI